MFNVWFEKRNRHADSLRRAQTFRRRRVDSTQNSSEQRMRFRSAADVPGVFKLLEYSGCCTPRCEETLHVLVESCPPQMREVQVMKEAEMTQSFKKKKKKN